MTLQYNIYFGLSAIVFMIVLVIYSHVCYNLDSTRNKEFYKLLIYVLFTDILDVVTAITISYAAVIPRMVNMILNTCYFGGNAILSYQFLKYADLSIQWFQGEAKVSIGYRIVLGCQAVFLTLNILNGWIFDFDSAGTYIHGPLYFMTYIVPYSCMAVGVSRMVCHMKQYTIQQRMSIFSFSLIAMIGAVIQIGFFPNILITSFSLSVGLIIVLFSFETPDYQKLMQTMEELRQAKLEAEEEKQKAEIASQFKSTFLANMSHEIRTPIHAVLGMNEMILRESEEEAILEYAANIESAGTGLLTLINDILDISKIESGRLELILTEYSLYQLLKDCYNLIDTRMKTKKLEFIIENEAMIPDRLYGDEARIRQIIFNLLTNAYKYTKAGKVILRVKQKVVSSTEIVLLIAVEDTGIGITEENQKRLFDMFERFDEKQNRNIEGSGLGLAITKQLVELMQGKIGVISTFEKGSLFYVELPQKVAGEEKLGNFYERYESVQEKRLDYKKWKAPQGRILIVDDVETNLIVTKSLLKHTELKIDLAESGEKCLELTQKYAYHLILLDHMMPKMDGIETLHRLKVQKGLNEKTPVAVSTANAISGAAEQYLEAGFDDYLSKPASGKELEELILKYLPKELIVREME